MSQTLKFGNKTWATKVGSTLAYNDENDNYKPLPFAFTRSTSATRVNKEGLIEVVTNDRPRIDYTDTSDGVLLLENAATNLVLYSEDYSQSVWTKSKATITSNSVVSPNGTLTADKLVEDTSIGEHIVYDLLITSSGNFSHSIFAKAEERTKIRISSGSNLHKVDFDLSNGSIILEVGATGSIDSMANGWYKLSISWNESSSVPQYAFVSLLDDNGLDSYQGNGSSGLYIWGSQYEQSSYTSSYIPTQGSATTRVAETASGAGNSEVFNDSEGVLFANIAALADDGTDRAITISDGTSSNRVTFYYGASSTLNYNIYSGGLVSFGSLTIPNISAFSKFSIKYKSNDFAFWVNGFEVHTGSSGNSPTGLDRLNISTFNASGAFFYGKTKEIGYYDTALTDLELETLTSYRTWESMVKELNLNVIYNG